MLPTAWERAGPLKISPVNKGIGDNDNTNVLLYGKNRTEFCPPRSYTGVTGRRDAAQGRGVARTHATAIGQEGGVSPHEAGRTLGASSDAGPEGSRRRD